MSAKGASWPRRYEQEPGVSNRPVAQLANGVRKMKALKKIQAVLQRKIGVRGEVAFVLLLLLAGLALNYLIVAR